MKKTLTMIALLGSILGSQAGLENLASEKRAITYEDSGKVEFPFELGRDYIQRIEVIGKVARAIKKSPYNVSTNASGKLVFDNPGSLKATMEFIRYTPKERGFKKEVGIVGKRPLSDFEAYLVLECEDDQGSIKYSSKMYTLLTGRFVRTALNGLRKIPPIDRKIKEIIKKEQEEVVKIVDSIAEEIKTNPAKFMERVREGAQGVGLSLEELKYVERKLYEFQDKNNLSSR